MKPLTSCRNRSGTRRLVAVHDEAGGLVGAIDVDHAAELKRPVGRLARASAGWRRRRPARRRAGRSRRPASGRTPPCTRRTGRRRGCTAAGRGRRTPAAARREGGADRPPAAGRATTSRLDACGSRPAAARPAAAAARGTPSSSGSRKSMVPLTAACIVAPPRSSWLDRLADRRLHQRRAGEVQAAALGHQQLVAQHRQVAAAGDAVAHDRGELRDARRRR